MGVRLFLAGIRQYLQPWFALETIFGIQEDAALPLIGELGIANVATGVVGVASLLRPGFVEPTAIAAAIFYGIAGVRHAAAHRTANETIAMVSDMWIAVVLAICIGAIELG